jgi:putative hydrolase of the HAD superfamily
VPLKPLCIVFDLDDTLYLERDYVRSGFRALDLWVRNNLGLVDFSLRAWALFERGERNRIFDRALLEAGLAPDRDTILTMVDLYRSHLPAIQLARDAAECLRNIQGRVHLALVSDGPERSQRNKMRALGLVQTFETVVLTSTLGTGFAKPHPKAFLQVQKHFGGSVQQYTYVADNPAKDFQGPHSLGWKKIRVRRRGGLYSSFEPSVQGRADLEVRDLHEVTHMFRGDGPSVRPSNLEFGGLGES